MLPYIPFRVPCTIEALELYRVGTSPKPPTFYPSYVKTLCDLQSVSGRFI